MLVRTGSSSRILTAAIAGASFALVVATASCTDDAASGTDPDGGGATGAFDAATTSPPDATSSSGEPGPGTDGGSSGTIPGGGLAFPIDVALMARGKPLNIDTVTDITVSSSLQYRTAYKSDGGLEAPLAYYRFTARTHTALAELPPGGVRVWWQRLRDDNTVGNYICREKNAVSGISTLHSNGSAGTESEPDNVWRNQCSWTLWKHPTEDAWYLRVPEGTSTAEGGTFVEDVHGGATEGYRIRVGGSSFGIAPFFRFRAKI